MFLHTVSHTLAKFLFRGLPHDVVRPWLLPEPQDTQAEKCQAHKKVKKALNIMVRNLKLLAENAQLGQRLSF